MSPLVLENTQIAEHESIIEYPSSDGEPMAETSIHVLAILSLIGALRHYFRNQKDVYVIGNIFLYYIKGNPKARKAPDVMVIQGVDASIERRSFKTWEENAVPSVIFEITSKETEEQDTINKLSLYASLGVTEYFLFDPLQEYLPEQFIGYRLADSEYSIIVANEDGEIFSESLKLILRPDGSMLRIVDPQNYQVIPTLDEAVASAEYESQRAEQEAQRAEQEAQRAEYESQRAKQAESENTRLNEIIAQLQQQLQKMKSE